MYKQNTTEEWTRGCKKGNQAVAVSILLYGCTTLMQTKCMKKKLNRNYTRMLQLFVPSPPNGQVQHKAFLQVSPGEML